MYKAKGEVSTYKLRPTLKKLNKKVNKIKSSSVNQTRRLYTKECIRSNGKRTAAGLWNWLMGKQSNFKIMIWENKSVKINNISDHWKQQLKDNDLSSWEHNLEIMINDQQQQQQR